MDNTPICSICSTKDTIIWRNSIKDGILCNQCFINKYLNKVGIYNSISWPVQDEFDDESVQDGDNSNVRKSQRVKNKQRMQIKNFVVDKGKGRRSLIFKKNVSRSITERANINTSNHLYYKGIYYQTGDVIAITDISGEIYYAQIKGFIKDAYLNIGTYVHWLIPNTRINENTLFNPVDYSLGFEENMPLDIDNLEFIARLPPDFYMHPNIPSFNEPFIPGDKHYIYTTLNNIKNNSKRHMHIVPSNDQIFLGNG